MRQDPSFTVTLGREELIINRRYETAVLANDFLIGLWFTLGSLAFVFSEWEAVGAWVFLVASLQYLARPTIRLVGNIHLRRVRRRREPSASKA
ncbi:MAG: YrhK family protein [Pseudomonadota bacterium]